MNYTKRLSIEVGSTSIVVFFNSRDWSFVPSPSIKVLANYPIGVECVGSLVDVVACFSQVMDSRSE